MFDKLKSTSDEAKKSEELLHNRVKAGAEQQMAVIQQIINRVIIDRLWYPRKIVFIAEEGTVKALYAEEQDKKYRIHPHALGQMASVVGLPIKFTRTLASGPHDEQYGWWMQNLLEHNLEQLYHKLPLATAYLRRAVGDQIRGFQGRNFKRNLSTAPLLKAFVEECGALGAGPIKAVNTDIKTILQCMLPYVFEPVKGEFVALGLTFENSDFGAGKLAISSTLLRISSNTTSIMDDSFRKIHLGKVIEADDTSDLEISDATVAAELEAHQSAIKDVVRSTLSFEAIERALRNIQLAFEHGIEWYKLRTSLAKVLKEKELDLVRSLLEVGDDLVDLPPVKEAGVATGWWAANVVGWLATKEEDPDRQKDMSKLAGSLIAKAG